MIAKYIASKLTIKRRSYLSKLTEEEITLSVSDPSKLNKLFETTNIYKLKAQIDLKIVEAYILS